MRLARFNLLSAAGRSSSTRFVGLPVPGAAAIMASVAFASQNAPHLAPQIICALVFVLTMALSALMISPIPYPALKIASWSGSLDNCRRRTLRRRNSVAGLYRTRRPIFCDSVRPLGAISRSSKETSLRSAPAPSESHKHDRSSASFWLLLRRGKLRAGTSSTNLIVPKRERQH